MNFEMTNEITVQGIPHKSHNPRDVGIYLEPEMQSHSGSYAFHARHLGHQELLGSVFTPAFISQPIIGNVSINNEQRERIHILAERILSNAHRTTHLDNMGLDSFSCDIVVLATALVLRNWNDDSGGDENFWEYICNQFALPYTESSFANSPEYKIFRESIKYCLSKHKRLEARDGKRYYTSLLIHSLAPKVKFHDLFEQIFSFYAKNLHYHYLRDDPAFSAFAYAMKHHFQTSKTRNDDVYIKSVQSSIAIKQYFLRCPEFMSMLVERIVRQMDSLVATGTLGKHENDYIDDLLVGWHEKRSREERTSDRKKRTEASSERIVTEFGNIRISYIYEAEKALLVIPAIRLGEESTEKPQVTIFRHKDDTNPYTADLRYYGNYICITSSKTEIPIDLLDHGIDVRRFDLRVLLTYDGDVVFDSGIKLFREAITFCDRGTEILKRPENEYVNIFTKRSCVVGGLETAPDCSIKSYGSYSIYRILIDKNTKVTVNDEPLYPVEQIISGMTLRLLPSPVNYCKYIESQHEYYIFSRQPMLEISSDKPNFEKQYQLVIDADTYSFADYYVASNNCYQLHLPKEKGLHDFRIVDNTTRQSVCELSYTVYENFTLDFDGFYFTENYDYNGTLSICSESENDEFPYTPADQNIMLVSYADGDLAIDIPILRCRLDGKELSEDVGQILWYTDIPTHALLDIEVPRGYSANIIVGSASFVESSIEIGNIIRANHNSKIEAVGVILRNEDAQPIEIKLFDIAFEPFFQRPPLCVENGVLRWSVEDNFIGDASTEFEVHIQHRSNDCGKYKLGCNDESLDFQDAPPDGVYYYAIHAKQPGFFSKYEHLVSDRFVIGDFDNFRFDGCAVIITEAITENDCLPLNHFSGIIKGLRYIGEQYLNGETQHYPCYEGKLFYKYNGKLRIYATADYERDGKYHEQINPVKMWVVNEFTISLRTPADDGLYVHKGWSSITDRKPPTKIMKLSAENWDTADYYHYKVIPLSEVENV
ncbi:MAG: hypothetical protein FWF80_08830 [Defluviitaleaceae bacterium]|nr:hypothetical protein [Defluviitaleaceae bacterium]